MNELTLYSVNWPYSTEEVEKFKFDSYKILFNKLSFGTHEGALSLYFEGNLIGCYFPDSETLDEFIVRAMRNIR